MIFSTLYVANSADAVEEASNWVGPFSIPEVNIVTIDTIPQKIGGRKREYLQGKMKRDRLVRQEGIRFLRSDRRLQEEISDSLLTESSLAQYVNDDKHESEFPTSQPTISVSKSSSPPVNTAEDASTSDTSMFPTSRPTIFSSQLPSSAPTRRQSTTSPTLFPSGRPSRLPSSIPTGAPSSKPIYATDTLDSSSFPSSFPTANPVALSGQETAGQSSTNHKSNGLLQVNIALFVVTLVVVVAVLLFAMRKMICSSMYRSHQPVSHQEDIELLGTHDNSYASSLRQTDKSKGGKVKW